MIGLPTLALELKEVQKGVWLTRERDHQKYFEENRYNQKLSTAELDECQDEIRKLELKVHEAEQKRRKVEEKHYSSLRYKQMCESEMQLNKSSMPSLVSNTPPLSYLLLLDLRSPKLTIN